MSHHETHENTADLQGHYEPQAPTADEKADALAAFAIITIGILAAIHFIYTGGLPAWLAQVL